METIGGRAAAITALKRWLLNLWRRAVSFTAGVFFAWFAVTRSARPRANGPFAWAYEKWVHEPLVTPKALARISSCGHHETR